METYTAQRSHGRREGKRKIIMEIWQISFQKCCVNIHLCVCFLPIRVAFSPLTPLFPPHSFANLHLFSPSFFLFTPQSFILSFLVACSSKSFSLKGVYQLPIFFLSPLENFSHFPLKHYKQKERYKMTFLHC